MTYVNGVDEDKRCFLCAAAEDPSADEERLVVHRRAHCFSVLNRYPYNNGHLLIAPKAHKAELAELSSEEALEIHGLLTLAVDALRRTMGPHGFNVGLNLGRPAGAGVPGHLHWHIVPRWNGDTNFMPVLADVKVIPQMLEDTWRMLRKLADE
jgi:ATP adenylyltransferase